MVEFKRAYLGNDHESLVIFGRIPFAEMCNEPVGCTRDFRGPPIYTGSDVKRDIPYKGTLIYRGLPFTGASQS